MDTSPIGMLRAKHVREMAEHAGRRPLTLQLSGAVSPPLTYMRREKNVRVGSGSEGNDVARCHEAKRRAVLRDAALLEAQGMVVRDHEHVYDHEQNTSDFNAVAQRTLAPPRLPSAACLAGRVHPIRMRSQSTQSPAAAGPQACASRRPLQPS